MRSFDMGAHEFIAPGDYNRDGVVDAADYTLWRDHLGSLIALPSDDTAGVGFDDYVRWKSHFGASSGSGTGTGSNTIIPEPATGIALHTAIAVMLMGRRVRRHRFSQL